MVCPIMTRGVYPHRGDDVELSSPVICLEEKCQLWVGDDQPFDCPNCGAKPFNGHCGLIRK
jgi:hypothetical protein